MKTIKQIQEEAKDFALNGQRELSPREQVIKVAKDSFFNPQKNVQQPAIDQRLVVDPYSKKVQLYADQAGPSVGDNIDTSKPIPETGIDMNRYNGDIANSTRNKIAGELGVAGEDYVNVEGRPKYIGDKVYNGEIRQGKSESLPNKIGRKALEFLQLRKTPEEQSTLDALTVIKAKTENKTIEQANKEIKDEAQKDFNTKLNVVMALGGVSGVAKYGVAKLATGIGSFMIRDAIKKETIKAVTNGKKENLTDFLSDNTPEGTKQFAELVEMALVGGLGQKAESRAVRSAILKIKNKIKPNTLPRIIKEIQKAGVNDSLNVLGLNDSASMNTIKRRYRELIQIAHPDRSTGNSREAAIINEAYDFLKKNYKTPKAPLNLSESAINTRNIKDLKILNLEPGASMSKVHKAFNSLSREKKLTIEQAKAYQNLKKYYNPYGESVAVRKAAVKRAQEISARETANKVKSKVKVDNAKDIINRTPIILSGKEQLKLKGSDLSTKLIGAAKKNFRPSISVTGNAAAEFVAVDKKINKLITGLEKRISTVEDKKSSIVKKINKGGLTETQSKKLVEQSRTASNLLKDLNTELANARKSAIKYEGPVTGRDRTSITQRTAQQVVGQQRESPVIKTPSTRVTSLPSSTTIRAVKTTPIKTIRGITNEVKKIATAKEQQAALTRLAEKKTKVAPIKERKVVVEKPTKKTESKTSIKDYIKKKTIKKAADKTTKRPAITKRVEKTKTKIDNLSYSDILKEQAKKKKLAEESKASSAIKRVLGGRSRESIRTKKTGITEKTKVTKTPKPKKKYSSKLLKMKREGKSVNDFLELSRKKYLDFLEGKTKTDESKEIDNFIEDALREDSKELEKKVVRVSLSPEARDLKTPVLKTKKGIIQKLFRKKEEFKLFNEARNFIHKYAKLVSEKNVKRGTKGVYRTRSGNIGVKSRNDIFTVTHEVAHSLDVANKITENVIKNKDRKLEHQLIKIFDEFYPTNKKLSYDTVLKEGYAELMEQYARAPKQISEKYKLLVDEFIKKGGKYSLPIVREAVRDMSNIVSKYIAMDLMDKTLSKMTFGAKNRKKPTIFTKTDRVIREVVKFDRMLERFARENGVERTENDPYRMFRYMDKAANISLTNLVDDIGFYSMKPNGEPVKKFNFNWYTLFRDLAKKDRYEEFSAYTANRRPYYQNKRLKEMEAIENPSDGEIAVTKSLKKTLKNSNFNEKENTAFMEKYGDSFTTEEEQFDKLAFAPIESLHNAGLIGDTFYNNMKNTKGYANFARDIVDDLEGEREGTLFAKGAINKGMSSLGKAKGSEKALIDPLMTTAKANMYVNEQIVLNETLKKIGRLDDFGEIEIVDKTPINKETGTFFPEINGNVVKYRDGNNIVKMRLSNLMRDVFDTAEALRKQDPTRKIVSFASSLFVHGTTGLAKPAFALKNVLIDAVPAYAQSKNEIVPVLDGVKAYIGIALKNPKYTKYWNEYKVSGGLRQTYVKSFEEDSRDVLKKMGIRGNSAKDYANISLEMAKDILGYIPGRAETLNRFAEYVASRERGNPHFVAMRDSDEVTAAFGDQGRLFNSAVLKNGMKAITFANAQIQYIYAGFKAIKDPITRKRALSAYATLAAVSSLLFYNLYAANQRAKESGDQDEIEKTQKMIDQYKNQQLYAKENNIIGYLGGDKLTKMRVAGTYNMLGTILTMALSEKFMNDEFKATDYARVLKDNVVPSVFDIFEPNPGNITPTILKPTFESLLNKKTFPNIKEIEPEGMRKKPSQYRYYPWTNRVAISLGQTEIAKKMDLSPLKIEAFMTGTFGTAIDDFTKYQGFFGPLKGVAESLKHVFISEEYDLSGRVFTDFYEKGNKIKNDYSYARNQKDRTKMRSLELQNDLFRNVSNLMTPLKKIANNGKSVPPSISNAIFKSVELYNKGKYTEARSEYRKIRSSANTFIRTYK